MFDDFDKIVLTEVEKSAFDKFSNSDTAKLSREEYKCLHRLGFIPQYMDEPNDRVYRLNNRGLHYRSFLSGQALEARRRKFRIWIPVLIDTVLSLSAIIISIIALNRTKG